MSEKRVENVIIVGGASAGYTSALYTSRAELEPLVIEGFQWGGQLQNTTDVENYPGFPEGIMGPELMQHFRAQAERFGTRFISDDATRIELSDGGIHRIWVGDEEHLAKAVILAMGAEPKRLGIPGEMELGGRGVSTCGVCDGAFFKGEDVVVIGGGDSAMEDSISVAKYANDLSTVHRRDDFRASKIMVERARETPNISFKKVGGAFVAIGHTPRSELVADQVDTDEQGYVLTRDGSTRTNLAGVFAVGDLVDHTYRQAVTAAGTGCMGALDAEWYLRDAPPSPEAHWVSKQETEEPGTAKVGA